MLHLDELHHLIMELEGEGHALAGRLRDTLDRLRTDFTALAVGGTTELGLITRELATALAPQLNELKTELFRLLLTEVQKTITGRPLTTAPDQVEPHPAPDQG